MQLNIPTFHESAKGPNLLRLRKHSRVLQPILERHTREGGFFRMKAQIKPRKSDDFSN